MIVSAESLGTGFQRMETCKCGKEVAIFRSFRTGKEYKSNNRLNKTAFHECEAKKRANEMICGCGAKVWEWTSKEKKKVYWTNKPKPYPNFHNCPVSKYQGSLKPPKYSPDECEHEHVEKIETSGQYQEYAGAGYQTWHKTEKCCKDCGIYL